MSDRTVARRYAQALYEEADQQGRVEAVDEDVEMIRASIDGSRELQGFFESPIIGRSKKENVIDALFQERTQPLTLRFLRLLVKKKREALTPEVVHAYRDLRDEQLNLVEAQVRTARPLPDGEKEKLKQRLETRTGKNIRLRVREDSDLIGGLVVRIGDTVYDGSVRHQLENLRERMKQQAGGLSGDGAAGAADETSVSPQ